MIEPGSFASMSRSATACAMKNAARTLSVKMASKSSTLTSGRNAGRFMPALLIEDLKRFGRGDRLPRRLDIGHVKHQRVGPLAARADRRCRILDFALGPRRERHMRAGCRQRRSRRQPDAAAAAGDERALAVEAEGGSLGERDRRHGGYTFPCA